MKTTNLRPSRLWAEFFVGLVGLAVMVVGMAFAIPVSLVLGRLFRSSDIFDFTGGVLHPDSAFTLVLYSPLLFVSGYLIYRAFNLVRLFSAMLLRIVVFAGCIVIGSAVHLNLIGEHRPYPPRNVDNSPFACLGFGGCEGRTAYGWPAEIYTVLEQRNIEYGFSYFDLSGVLFNLAIVGLLIWVLCLSAGMLWQLAVKIFVRPRSVQ